MSRSDSEFEFAHDSASILPLNRKPLHRYATKILLAMAIPAPEGPG